MRSIAEQMSGLETLRAKVPSSRLSWQQSDVVVLAFGKREICYASGGYDLWIGGRPRKFDMSLEDAAQELLLGERA